MKIIKLIWLELLVCSAMTLQAAEEQPKALQELQAAAVVHFVLPHKPDENEESIEIKKSILECCDAYKDIMDEFSDISDQKAVPLPDIIEPHSLNDLHEYTQRYLHKADSSQEALEGLSTYIKTFPNRGSNTWMLRVYNFLVTVNYFDLQYQDYEDERQVQEHAIAREKLIKKQGTFSRQRNELLGHEIASVLLDPVLIQDIDSAVIHKMITTPYEYCIQKELEWSSAFCEKTLTDHSDWIRSVEWSPDGTKIASGSADRIIKIWDTITGICLKTLAGDNSHKSWVESVAWNFDGTKIASGSEDHTIKIWNTITGACLKTLTCGDGRYDWVKSVAWSPDDIKIASGLANNTIKIWDAATGVCLKTLTHGDYHSNWIRSIAWSSDSIKIVAGSNDKTIKIWDALTGTCLMSLAGDNGHRGSVMSVAWSPDGTKIISGSLDEIIKIWDSATGICLKTLTGADGHGHCYSVARSPDGTKIVLGSANNTIKIWDMVTGICLITLTDADGHRDWINSVAWSANGAKIASGSSDNTIKIWAIPASGLEAYNMWLAKHCPAKVLDEGQ